MASKCCRKCGTEKLLTEYPRRPSNNDGTRNECNTCYHAYLKQNYELNREERSRKNKEYRLAHWSQWIAYTKTEAFKQCKRLSDRKYRAAMPESQKVKYRERIRRWAKNNPSKVSAKQAKRMLRIADATPPWADIKAIRQFYANCPEGYHVDHIIPLLGKNVSGLHCLENLQYLPARENLKKSNKFNLTTEAEVSRI